MTRSAEYWDGIAGAFGTDRQSDTWRAYMQRGYTRLAERWFAGCPAGRTLKTDLFEEAVTSHHVLGALGPHVAGMDLSLTVVRHARARLHESALDRARAGNGSVDHAPLLVAADARCLPWADHSMARILSGSSLDHFTDPADIRVALCELARCLRPGGCLVLTLDNPHNPLLRLRNGLPFPWLARIGLVPYFVGATYTRAQAIEVLTGLGLDVTHVGAMAHVPRAPAIWASNWHARRNSGVSSRLLRWYSFFDRLLEDSPLRFRTGYYLAFRAIKPVTTP